MIFEGIYIFFKPSCTEEEQFKKTKRIGLQGMFAQAAYHLQFPKIGMVFSEGSKYPFKDYQVKPRWVTDYLQVRVSSNKFGCVFFGGDDLFHKAWRLVVIFRSKFIIQGSECSLT